MDLRHLLNVAYAALMSGLTPEQQEEWHADPEKKPEPVQPQSRNVGALMRIAAGMPRK